MFNNLSKSNIGLLGGSFDPAHQGHLYISNKIINILGLNQLWWLVASQNPLKKKELSDCVSHDEVINLTSKWGFDIGRRWGEY